MLVPILTLLYRSGLYQYFVSTESDCTDIDIQCTEKTCTESVCTEIVLYRKRPTPSADMEENANKLHLCTDFNSPTHVTVYAKCIYVLTEYLKY